MLVMAGLCNILSVVVHWPDNILTGSLKYFYVLHTFDGPLHRRRPSNPALGVLQGWAWMSWRLISRSM